jgi:type II secretory ATPase GspE/PulE/Tfp pilus assembly ATPase PilB-like protein
VQVNPKIEWTFAKALRAFLRADPDVIMVGEMRDAETAQMGIEASLTGHLVLSTLHTNSAPETVTRLIDMGLDPSTLPTRCCACWRSAWCAASATTAASRAWRRRRSQRTARRLPARVSARHTLFSRDTCAQSGSSASAWKAGCALHHSPGCEHCGHTGTRGRAGCTS